MKISILLKTLLFGMLLTTSVHAEEINEPQNCSDTYNICSEKCESLENGFEQCLMKCDLEYEKCSDEGEDKNQK
jgi:hypothetical protein